MGAYDLQFVDSIAASPAVRLDLFGPGWTVRTGTTFGTPELDRMAVRNPLGDGDQFPAAAYRSRTITLALRVDGVSDDVIAGLVQRLFRELDRPRNILRYRPGTTNPVFFRTYRAGPDAVNWDPVEKLVTAQVPAEPFALGLRENLPSVTVYNDPAEGSTLNANPNFETDTFVQGDFEVDMTGWTGINGTAAQSTAQAHAGTASAFVTPGGTGVVARVEADMSNALPAVAGQSFTASAWVRPTGSTKPAAVQLTWRDSGGGFLSSTVVTAAATAGAWQFLTVTANAPAGAAFAQPAAGIGSTPTAADTAYVDELRLSTPANWTAIGGTVARSTAQAHEGVASLLLTPSGVDATVQARSENVPATAGVSYRASAWVWCAVARSVGVGINWRDSGGNLVAGGVSTTVSVSATTWTYLEVSGVCPAGATQAQITPGNMTGTPPASNTVWIDEARLRRSGGVGGMCWDITSIKGDVETPLYLSVPGSGLVVADRFSSRQSVIAVRRRGTPSQAPFVLQAESMTPVSVDTTVQPNSAVMSGSGSNFMRTTFATVAPMATRLSITNWPAAPSVDVRGKYRVYMRYRSSVIVPGQMQARLQWGTSNVSTVNDTVDLIRTYGGAGGPYILYADLGDVQFPQGYDPVSDGPDGVELPVDGMYVAVDAARLSGSAALDIDCLLFVPADDRTLLITWPPSGTPVTLTYDADRNQVYAEASTGAVVGKAGSSIDGLPPLVSPGVTNRVYFLRDVGQTSSTGSATTGDDITASTVISPYYWPKYLSVRPVAS